MESFPASVTISSDFSFLGAFESSFVLVEDSWLFSGTDSFFHFILLFWNHVFTCVSFNPNVCASFARFDVSKYFCSENVFSKTRSCRSVKTVRDLRHLRPLGVRKVGFTRKYTGSWLKTSGLGSWNIGTSSRCLCVRMECIPNFNELLFGTEDLGSWKLGCLGTRKGWRGTKMSSILKEERPGVFLALELPWQNGGCW